MICIEIFGVHGDRARDYAVNLGVALQLTNILRDVAGDLGHGRLYLPLDDLARFGCTEDDLRAGRVTGPVRDLLAFEASRAKDFYRRAAELAPTARAGGWWPPRSWRPSIAICSRASNEAGTTCSRRVSACPGLVRPGSRLASGRAAEPMAAPDVIVVGAGFAGLSAAVRLARRGARVLVVEERRRLGGRASAFADPETGEVVDNGQHALFGCYHETFAFLRDIGAEGDVRLEERLDLEIVDRAGQRSRLTSAPLPPPLHLVGGLLRWPALAWSDKVAALRSGPGASAAGRSDRDRDGTQPADRDRVAACAWADAAAVGGAVGAARGGRAQPVAARGGGRPVRRGPGADVQRQPS